MAALRRLARAQPLNGCSSSAAFQPRWALARTFGTSAPMREEMIIKDDSTPRWQQTPPQMRMPFRVRQPVSIQQIYNINSDPVVLHAAYDRFLGSKKAHTMLPEDLRWLAVTHKSFDHGRRGSNDRLAFLGKRIVDLQCSLSLLEGPKETPSGSSRSRPESNPAGLALQGLSNLNVRSVHSTLERTRVATVAREYGLDKVLRWKPRKADNLRSSGIDTVLAHTVYSIVGAVLLHCGGEAATSVVNKRILGSLKRQSG